MAVPSLWPWVACLLAVLLSLGFGLDTREGESPALSPGAPSPSQQTGRPNAEFPPRTCLFPYWDMKTGGSFQKDFPPGKAVSHIKGVFLSVPWEMRRTLKQKDG